MAAHTCKTRKAQTGQVIPTQPGNHGATSGPGSWGNRAGGADRVPRYILAGWAHLRADNMAHSARHASASVVARTYTGERGSSGLPLVVFCEMRFTIAYDKIFFQKEIVLDKLYVSWEFSISKFKFQ